VLNQARRFGVVAPAPLRKGPAPSKREALMPAIVAALLSGMTQRAASRALGIAVSALVWQARQGKLHAPELLAIVGDARPCRRTRRSC
jgi:hypothetical protein